jgi:prophage regulatory protein
MLKSTPKSFFSFWIIILKIFKYFQIRRYKFQKERKFNMRRILRINEVIDICGLSKDTIWRLEKLGKFPSRKRIGLNAIGWDSFEIEEWIKSRVQVYIKPNEEEITKKVRSCIKTILRTD